MSRKNLGAEHDESCSKLPENWERPRETSTFDAVSTETGGSKARPGPATVVEELNYHFPAAMVSVVPTCVGLLYENLHTVLHWP